MQSTELGYCAFSAATVILAFSSGEGGAPPRDG